MVFHNGSFSFAGRDPVGDAILDSCRNTQTGETGNGAVVRAQSVRDRGKIAKIQRRRQIDGKNGRRGRDETTKNR